MKPATALPWQVDDDFHILAADGESIIAPTECDAKLGECYTAEDAAYIVHACNRYPVLVAALAECRATLDVLESVWPAAHGYTQAARAALKGDE